MIACRWASIVIFMTISRDVAAESTRTPRSQRLRHYAMTPPTFFAVEYAINPWMDTARRRRRPRASPSGRCCASPTDLGHTVELVEPVPGLPDMVYAANAGLIINGTAIVARFKHPERHGESIAYSAWMDQRGHDPVATRHVNEGQGDLLVVGSTILAGTGFRTHPQAHAEVADITGMPVVSLDLVDPRFYHLDTALTVLDDTSIAYYPPAFTATARGRLRDLFPDAIEVASTDAYVLGLNAVSRRQARRVPRPGHGFRQAALPRRLPPHRSGSLRAAQGRRLGEMLHAGGVFMTMADTVKKATTGATAAAIALDNTYAAHNYSPLPVVAASARGRGSPTSRDAATSTASAAYSAVDFGHHNDEIVAAAHRQLDAVTLVSRAFHSDQLGPFCAALAELCGKDMVLPMNTGAEAVESGLKVARKWGTDVKGVGADLANIIVADNNFHGRTISIVSFSSDATARGGFGPFTPGFRSVPFGDADAVAAAIDENTVAVLIEPIQGEAGIIVPPDDYLPPAARDVHPAQRAADRRRDPVRSGAHRSHLRSTTGAWCPTSTCSARPSAGAWFPCRRSWPTATSSECFTPGSTARRSAAIHWPQPSAPPWSTSCGAANSSPAQPNSGCTCMRDCGR